MPDKNAVHRAAAALRTALVGKQIVGFEAEKLSGPMPRLGRTVEDVVSHGRHLEICWDDDIVLHTNLGLRGSWELYRRGETWRKPQRMARVVVETIDWVAVCFNARDVETYRPDSFIRHPNFGRLGPDLHDANADINECVRRLMTYENPTIAIADVLLDQHVATGIGNVYRCEVLWSSEVHPLAPVGLLPQSTCVEIVRTAAALLQQQNTESPTDLFAYGRNGQPCKRCSGVIAVQYHGSPERLLYWCPSCQLGCAPAPEPDISDPIARLTDPHPAGSMYISEMVQNKGLFSDNGDQAAS